MASRQMGKPSIGQLNKVLYTHGELAASTATAVNVYYPSELTSTPKACFLGKLISSSNGGGVLVNIGDYNSEVIRLTLCNTRSVAATGIKVEIFYIT